jgi:hypothetical protein
MLNRSLVLSSLLLISACGGGSADPDGGSAIDSGNGGAADADMTGCLTAAERTNPCTVDVSGTVAYFSVDDPLTFQPTVTVNTAFDSATSLPAGCQPLASLTAGTDHTFGQGGVSCASPEFPPHLVIMADDTPGSADRLARVAMSQQLTCTGSDCGTAAFTVKMPTATQAEAWRRAMKTDGMVNADTIGLALVTYRNAAGGSVPGVTPTINGTAATPGTQVRFLGIDRTTLTGKFSASTSTSGLAFIAITGDTAMIGGTADGFTFTPVEVPVAAGWFFMTDVRSVE